MIITIPHDWYIPDEVSGELPRITVGATADTWVDIINYWCSLGYFVTPSTGNTLDLKFPPTGWLKEKNAFMQVAWWRALCNTTSIHGDVEGWQAVWQVHPSVYDQGLVPLTIPNSTYTDDQEQTQQRLWKQWGTQNHSHYYLPAEVSVQAGLTADRYFIPTWSWGSDILGVAMMHGEEEQGVNLVSRKDFQQALNDERLQVVPVTPTP